MTGREKKTDKPAEDSASESYSNQPEPIAGPSRLCRSINQSSTSTSDSSSDSNSPTKTVEHASRHGRQKSRNTSHRRRSSRPSKPVDHFQIRHQKRQRRRQMKAKPRSSISTKPKMTGRESNTRPTTTTVGPGMDAPVNSRPQIPPVPRTTFKETVARALKFQDYPFPPQNRQHAIQAGNQNLGNSSANEPEINLNEEVKTQGKLIRDLTSKVERMSQEFKTFRETQERRAKEQHKFLKNVVKNYFQNKKNGEGEDESSDSD